MSEESERVKYLLKYWSHLQLAREYEQLENIIKEVREYINEDIKGNYFKRYDDGIYKACDDMLKILDKENK